MKEITPAEFGKKIAKALKDSSSSHAFFFIQQALGEQIDWTTAHKVLDGIIANETVVTATTQNEIRSILLVNSIRQLSDTQRAGLCFDLFERIPEEQRERIKGKIKELDKK